MVLEVIKNEFTVCKVENVDCVDLNSDFTFFSKCDNELSLVCLNEKVPENTLESEPGWSCFRITGQLDFSLIGIIADISSVLSSKKIGIFVISTYNTDYVMVKSDRLNSAIAFLKAAGYEFIE